MKEKFIPPEANVTQDDTGQVERFVGPRPSRRQELSLKAAGVLLRKGTDDPGGILDAYVVDVGGFVQENSEGSGGGLGYRHDGAEQVLVGSKWDQTSSNRPITAFKTARDLHDARGHTDIHSAVARTAGGQKQSGAIAGKLRGKVATRLVRHATKGVGSHAYTKSSQSSE